MSRFLPSVYFRTIFFRCLFLMFWYKKFFTQSQFCELFRISMNFSEVVLRNFFVGLFSPKKSPCRLFYYICFVSVKYICCKVLRNSPLVPFRDPPLCSGDTFGGQLPKQNVVELLFCQFTGFQLHSPPLQVRYLLCFFFWYNVWRWFDWINFLSARAPCLLFPKYGSVILFFLISFISSACFVFSYRYISAILIILTKLIILLNAPCSISRLKSKRW